MYHPQKTDWKACIVHADLQLLIGCLIQGTFADIHGERRQVLMMLGLTTAARMHKEVQ
jgi:hypothetical protein